MRLNKVFAALATIVLAMSFVNAQPSDPNAVWIGMQYIGTSFSPTRNFFLNNQGTETTIDLSGQSGIHYILVTTYVRATPDQTLGRLGLINTYINLNIPGVSVFELPNNNWDGGSTRTDARKNAFSLDFGNRDIDSAGNDLKDNSARPYDSTAPQASAGRGAAGKSLFPGGLTDGIEGPLYSFVISVDMGQVNQLSIPIEYARVGSTNGVELRTNFGYEFSPNFAPAVAGGQILIPEPASMIALGSGLVGLLALRRRRAN